mmetsp:Transcript_87634/g.268148  ORF Transcript_87634/g.268148 Transcript_87634/m.268148 type:complete len:592 (-) Transcript_87634:348-2123(-)
MSSCSHRSMTTYFDKPYNSGPCSSPSPFGPYKKTSGRRTPNKYCSNAKCVALSMRTWPVMHKATPRPVPDSSASARASVGLGGGGGAGGGAASAGGTRGGGGGAHDRCAGRQGVDDLRAGHGRVHRRHAFVLLRCQPDSAGRCHDVLGEVVVDAAEAGVRHDARRGSRVLALPGDLRVDDVRLPYFDRHANHFVPSHLVEGLARDARGRAVEGAPVPDVLAGHYTDGPGDQSIFAGHAEARHGHAGDDGELRGSARAACRERRRRRIQRPPAPPLHAAAGVRVPAVAAEIPEHGAGAAAPGEQGEEPDLPGVGRGDPGGLQHPRVRTTGVFHPAQRRQDIAPYQFDVQHHVLQPLALRAPPSRRHDPDRGRLLGHGAGPDGWPARHRRHGGHGRPGAAVRPAVRHVDGGVPAELDADGAVPRRHRADFHLRAAGIGAGPRGARGGRRHRQLAAAWRDPLRGGRHALSVGLAAGAQRDFLHRPWRHLAGRRGPHRGGQELIASGVVQDVRAGEREDRHRRHRHIQPWLAHAAQALGHHTAGSRRLHRLRAGQLGPLLGEAGDRVVGEVEGGAVGRIHWVKGGGLGFPVERRW